MSKINNELFENMPISSAARKLMIPTILSSLVMVLYSLADTYFVGILNEEIEIAAVSFASPLLISFNAVNNLFGIGSSSVMSRALGRKDIDTASKCASFGIYGCILSSILLSLGCLIFISPLLKILGVTMSAQSATFEYVKWVIIFGAAPSILNVVLAYLLRAEGKALHASIGVMSGCILNIVLDPIFILPWGLGMKAAGAGCATFISNVIASVYFIVILKFIKKDTCIKLHPRYFPMDKALISSICAVGIPASIQNLLNVTSVTVMNNYVSVYGTAAIAAMGIAQKVYMVPMQISQGGSQGIMPIISYSYGSKNITRFEEAIKYGAKVMLPGIIAISIIYCCEASFFIEMFSSHPDVIDFGVVF